MSLPRPAATSRDLTGSRLGAYEVRDRIGAGGMGEVYRARDSRLGRDVALKILPEALASDPDRVRRFEKEARAASALNHPNIVTVYEVGSADSLSFIAMELVEGRTLRDLISAGALPVKRLLDISCQVSSGLARAHEAGIVHRDLKPENIMVSKDGFAKILDFGLAKRLPSDGGAGSHAATMSAITEEGFIVGTAGYMSPEQAAGRPVDFRSDQFSFGSILYEMGTGRRAFERPSKAETLAAIIREEPEPIEKSSPQVPGPLRWMVERCLSKEPSHRYASTHDLAQELKVVRDHLTEISGISAAASAVAAAPVRLRLWALLTVAGVLAVLVAVFAAGRRSGDRPIPEFRRLTYRHGAVWSARFVPDGRTIVYGAAWDGAPIRLFSMRTDGRDSTDLKFGSADVASVSSQGELAMLLGRPVEPNSRWVGTLARAPLAGGAPREMTDGVAAADWSPDGKSLAIARKVGEKHRLEFPIGKVLYETAGFIEALRVSPGGDQIAFAVGGSDASVDIVDLAGKHSVLSRGWKRLARVAWSPDGHEVWFTVNDREWRTPLYAVTLSGKLRLLMRLPPFFQLQDVSRDGQALVSIVALRSSMVGLSAGETRERDLSWHEGSLVKSMTPDGKTLLFDEGAEGFFHTVYVRPMDGSPAKRLGEGRSLAISSDGQWVVANTKGRGSPLVLLPTGAGDQRALECDGHKVEEAAFFPDGKRLLLRARDPGHGDRSYVKDLDTGAMRQIGPEGTSCRFVSPDGKDAACVGPRKEGAIYPVEGGDPRSIPGFKEGEEPVLWSSDGRSLFVCAGGFTPLSKGASLEVFRLDLATGKRELWHAFTPADRAALMSPSYSIALTPDGKSYAYSFLYAPSDLYLVTGLE